MAYGASCSPARFSCYGAAQTIAARLLAYRRCVWGCLARKWLGGSLWTRERTLGLILAVAVHPADLQDRDGALLVLNRQTRRLFPFLETIFADGAYGGEKLCWAMADSLQRPNTVLETLRDGCLDRLCAGLFFEKMKMLRNGRVRARVGDRI